MRRVPAEMTDRARALRRDATEAERLLWRALSGYRPRFTRQLVIGRYIADFACRKAKLIIELDGSQHLDALAYDAERSEWLASQGWKVLRFWNGDVVDNIEGVVTVIVAQVAECLGDTHPQPLPYREGRR